MTPSCSVKCFGTGDGWPCADRRHSAFLYRLGRTSVLVDCGEPIDSALKASGAGYDSFDAILLSHLHSDHFGGLFMLLQGCWLERRRKPLPIYLPKRAIPPLRQMLNTAFLFDEVLPFRLSLRPLVPPSSLNVGGVRVSSFRTSHLDGFRARFGKKYRADFNPCCFLLQASSRRVGHSADLGKPEDLEPLLAKPLDLLVCELAHFAPARLFRYLRGRDIRRVVFVHLARGNWNNLPKLRRLAAKMLPDIPHRFARDDDTIPF